MAPDAVEARLSQIQGTMQELCRLQGEATAEIKAVREYQKEQARSHEICRAECAAHRKSLWEKNDAQDEKIGKTREEQAGETGTNRAKWATWTALALLALSSAAGWITNLGKH